MVRPRETSVRGFGWLLILAAVGLLFASLSLSGLSWNIRGPLLILAVLMSIVGQVLSRRNAAESIGDVSRMWQVSDLTQGQSKDVEIVQRQLLVAEAGNENKSPSPAVLTVIKSDPVKMAGRAALCGLGTCLFGFLAFACWDGDAWWPLVTGNAVIAALSLLAVVSYLRSAIVKSDALVFRCDGLVDKRRRGSNVIPWCRMSLVQLERDTVNSQTVAWKITIRVEQNDGRVELMSLDAGGLAKHPETVYRMILSAATGELGKPIFHSAGIDESTGGDKSIASCPHCGRINSIYTRVCPRCERRVDVDPGSK